MIQAKNGFSIVEIMIGIAILAVIAMIVVPNVMGQWQKAKKDNAKLSIRNISGAIEMYEVQVNQLPKRIDDLVRKPSDPQVKDRWAGPYLKNPKDIIDPWGNKYQYKLTPQGEHKYELYSFGPDGRGAPKEEWINIWNLS